MSLLCSQPCMTDGIHTSLIQFLSTQQGTTFLFIYFVTHIFELQPSEMLADLLFSVTSIFLALLPSKQKGIQTLLPIKTLAQSLQMELFSIMLQKFCYMKSLSTLFFCYIFQSLKLT